MALALTIGATNQTAKIRAQSMSLKFNTFDLALINPSVVPGVDDALTLSDPAWAGVVKSVKVLDTVEKGSSIVVEVTATNADVLASSTAPFELSDTPNNSSTFGYKQLATKVARNTDGTLETTGTCTVFETGLWPGMNVLVTSANHALSATSFPVQEVIASWPSLEAAPEYAVTFGSKITSFAGWVRGAGGGGASHQPPPGSGTAPTCSETFQRSVAPGGEGGVSELLGLSWHESWTGAGPATYVTPGKMVIPPPDPSGTPSAFTHHVETLDFGSLTLPVETLELVELTIPLGGTYPGPGPALHALSSINSGSNTSEWEWTFPIGLFEDQIGTQIDLVGNLRDNSIGALNSDSATIQGALEQNHRLWVRRRCEAPKRLKLKAWWDGDNEPDWMIDITGTHADATSPERLKYRTSAVGTADVGGAITPLSICFVAGASCSDGSCASFMPNAGDWVAMRLIGYGNDVDTSFVVPGGYIAGSLTVEVDGLVQNATETDPANGVFTLDFAPQADHGDATPELIEASWRRP